MDIGYTYVKIDKKLEERCFTISVCQIGLLSDEAFIENTYLDNFVFSKTFNEFSTGFHHANSCL